MPQMISSIVRFSQLPATGTVTSPVGESSCTATCDLLCVLLVGAAVSAVTHARSFSHQCMIRLNLSCLCACLHRPDYMTTFVDKLIDWDNVAKRFAAATS